MTLLNVGLAAAGLACVAIPIIIHLLFRKRRKPIMWGAMRFLLEAYRRQRRRLTLEQLLLLLARCAVVALIALAVGRPALERAGVLGAGQSRTVYLLVDNGLASSARAVAGAGSALDRHTRAAAELLAALGPSDRAGLIALGGPAEALVAPASPDIGAVQALVEALEPTDGPTDIAGAMERLRAELGRDEARRADGVIVAILSDFLTGSGDTATPLPVTLEGLEGAQLLVSRPAPGAPGNVQIVSVAPMRPVVLTGASPDAGAGQGAEQVRVKLRRTGPSVAEAGVTTLRLRAVAASSDAPVVAGGAQLVVRWKPGESELTPSLPIDLRALGDAATGAGDDLDGGVALVAEIDRDGVASDNVYRRPVTLRDALRVGVITRRRFGAPPSVDRLDPADWLRLALRPSAAAPVEIIEIEPAAVDAPSLAGLSAVMLVRPDLIDADGWRRLRHFVDAGGMLAVFPPTEPTVHLWTDSFTSAMSLPWGIAREVKTFSPPATLAAEQAASTLLEIIAPELGKLAAPVRVERMLPLEETPGRIETLLSLADGAPWAVAGSPAPAEGEGPAEGAPAPADQEGRGLVVYFASAPALSWTDLPAKPLMLPLMQELVRQGVGRAHGAWTAVAGATVAAPGRVVELRAVGAERTEASVIVDDTGRTSAPVRQAGLFRGLDSRGVSRGLVAVNADADAGRTDVQAPAAVQAWLSGAGGGAGAPESFVWLDRADAEGGGAGAGLAALAADGRGSPISLPLLIAALAFAIAETVMARYFSHAFREDGPLTADAAGSVA